MRKDIALCVFWAVVWFIVFALCLVGFFFWRPAIIIVATIGLGMAAMFVYDGVTYLRLK